MMSIWWYLNYAVKMLITYHLITLPCENVKNGNGMQLRLKIKKFTRLHSSALRANKVCLVEKKKVLSGVKLSNLNLMFMLKCENS